jgi:Allophanate hydrolase C-terminal domain
VYRLFTVEDRHPAMIRDDDAGFTIEAELYDVPDDVWPSIRDTEPSGLYRGPVLLDDGREVEGMLGERALVEADEAREISQWGGWRAYRRAIAGDA